MVRNLSKEEVELMEEWLNLKSMQVEKSVNVPKKTYFNNKYLGAIKFITSLNGSVIYIKKNTHKIELTELPNVVILTNANDTEMIGAMEILNNAGFPTTLEIGTNKIKIKDRIKL